MKCCGEEHTAARSEGKLQGNLSSEHQEDAVWKKVERRRGRKESSSPSPTGKDSSDQIPTSLTLKIIHLKPS